MRGNLLAALSGIEQNFATLVPYLNEAVGKHQQELMAFVDVDFRGFLLVYISKARLLSI